MDKSDLMVDNPGFEVIFLKTWFHMPAAGYSGTPLRRKLGIKPGWKLRLIGAPADYFRWLEEDLSGQLCSGRTVPDFVHLFAVTRLDFERAMAGLVGICGKNPAIVVWGVVV